MYETKNGIDTVAFRVRDNWKMIYSLKKEGIAIRNDKRGSAFIPLIVEID